MYVCVNRFDVVAFHDIFATTRSLPSSALDGSVAHAVERISAIGWYRMQTRNSAVLPRITVHDVDSARRCRTFPIPKCCSPSLSFPAAQLTFGPRSLHVLTIGTQVRPGSEQLTAG